MFRHLLATRWGRAAASGTRWLPSRCTICHAWPAEPVCEACIARFAQPQTRCLSCALPLPTELAHCGACLATPPPLDTCLAAVPYGYPWSDIVARFKFNAKPGWARPMALLMRSMPFVEPALDKADWIVPVPLSPQRLKARGYNQAWELARHLAADTRKRDAHLLLRLTDAPAQVGLNRAERLRNLRSAFAVDPLRAGALKAKHVVLVDDVMTSGATLHAAALALRAAGVAHITALVFARTDPLH